MLSNAAKSAVDPVSSIPVQTPNCFIKTKDEYVLEDFRIVVKLGNGAFGNVYLVELNPALNQVSSN